jgi:putative tricarboxylic transport membrane protein
MRIRDKVSLYCFIAFSIFILEESWRIGLGNLHQPGPGSLPFICAAILGLLALFLLVAGERKAVERKEPFFKKERLTKFLVVLLMCFGYGFALNYIGFVLCTWLFVLISMKTIDPKKWGHAVAVATVTAFVFWLVFDYWLQIQTPKGTWVYAIYESGLSWK